mmetsp:Transcript_30120/g.73167  ORF Transcript_30120/g.73167 Transcript_30120/m.73167 type:complete len:347 (-) Transcript_30120:2835-3875(-)
MFFSFSLFSNTGRLNAGSSFAFSPPTFTSLTGMFFVRFTGFSGEIGTPPPSLLTRSPQIPMILAKPGCGSTLILFSLSILSPTILTRGGLPSFEISGGASKSDLPTDAGFDSACGGVAFAGDTVGISFFTGEITGVQFLVGDTGSFFFASCSGSFQACCGVEIAGDTVGVSFFAGEVTGVVFLSPKVVFLVGETGSFFFADCSDSFKACCGADFDGDAVGVSVFTGEVTGVVFLLSKVVFLTGETGSALFGRRLVSFFSESWSGAAGFELNSSFSRSLMVFTVASGWFFCISFSAGNFLSAFFSCCLDSFLSESCLAVTGFVSNRSFSRSRVFTLDSEETFRSFLI